MNAETPGWGLCMGGSLHTDDGKPAASESPKKGGEIMNKHPKRVYVVRRILALVMAVFLVAAAYGMYQELTTPAYECPEAPVVVEKGDTLWRIAEKRCTGDMLEITDELVRSYGTEIQPGQVIQLP